MKPNVADNLKTHCEGVKGLMNLQNIFKSK